MREGWTYLLLLEEDGRGGYRLYLISGLVLQNWCVVCYPIPSVNTIEKMDLSGLSVVSVIYCSYCLIYLRARRRDAGFMEVFPAHDERDFAICSYKYFHSLSRT